MNMEAVMARSRSSGRWLREHHDDHYVREARRQGYRSRAAFKLLEIQERDRVLIPGQCVVDLGAAPGGWSQVAMEQVGINGRVVALDVLAMDVIPGVLLLQADFTDAAALAALETLLDGHSPDLVLSDMAPNISGMRAVDQPRAMLLAELARDFALDWLNPGGDLLVKVFQGEGFDRYLRTLRSSFRQVVTRKPAASRPRSREVYLLARGRQA